VKTVTIAMITAGLLAAAPAIAAHESHVPDAKESAGIRDAEPCPAGGQDLFDYMMSNLEVQMEAIRDTDDPEERRRLLRNHMQTIREALDLLDGPSAAPGAAPRGGPEKGKGGMMRGSSMHRDLEQRVDRLQKLMEHIIEHEQAEGENGRG
jgi:hypothetical protein